MSERNLKIMITGDGDCGKSDIAQRLAQRLGITYMDSSWFAAERIVYPVLKHSYGYTSVEECHDDRANCRSDWFDLILEYNTPDGDRMTRELLAEADIYIGMRSRHEFNDSRRHFDLVIWVDSDGRVPKEDKSSMQLNEDDADYVFDNRGDISEINSELERLVAQLTVDGWIKE